MSFFISVLRDEDAELAEGGDEGQSSILTKSLVSLTGNRTRAAAVKAPNPNH